MPRPQGQKSVSFQDWSLRRVINVSLLLTIIHFRQTEVSQLLVSKKNYKKTTL